MTRRKTRLIAVAAAVLTATGWPADATAKLDRARSEVGPACASRAGGGEWPSLNHDLHNTRSQPEEDRIGPKEAGRLERAWSFDGASVGIETGTRSTPVVADGCVYLAFGEGYLGALGHVVALNAETGQLIWHEPIDGSVLGLTAANGMIYVTPSRGTRGDVEMPVVTGDYQPAGSYALALDARTGQERWRSVDLDDGKAANGTFVNASPVVYSAGGRNLLFVPLAGGGGDGARVPMYFIDALSGQVVRRAFSLSEADYQDGYGGTGIWSTAAYDRKSQQLFVGTADSDGHTRQHRYNNALLRIDANPRSPRFATVAAHYAGTTEHANQDAFIGSEKNPACKRTAGKDAQVNTPTFFDTSASPSCLELDLDFGASPNLYLDERGALRVGALQKSGVYHSVVAATMEGAWARIVGPGGAAMSSATAAIEGDQVLVGATPNLLYGLGAQSGGVRWAATTDLDLFAYQPVTVANGVLYTISDSGYLIAVDSSNGIPLLRRSIALDGGLTQCLGVGAGVAVARNTVFAPCDAGGPSDLAGITSPPGGLVAYRLAG